MVDAVMLDERDPLAERLERAAVPILAIGLLLTLFLAAHLVPPPNFDTDLSAFAAETDADRAATRFSAVMAEPGARMYIQVRTAESNGNVLTWDAIQQQNSDLQLLQEFSNSSSGFILTEISVVSILQTGLGESENGSGLKLENVDSWAEYLEMTGVGECSADGADDALLSAAAITRASLLNHDFDYDPVCDWLAGDLTAEPIPVTSSTLWVIEVRSDLFDGDRIVGEVQIRELLRSQNLVNDSILSYTVISDGLISNEINEGSLTELIKLLSLAILTVVIVLAIAFRSFRFVAFPLAALTAALIWTYGTAAAAGMRFSILEVAVAPVILGLGIDYSIHLQRTYERFREEGMGSADAWVKSCRTLAVALGLAVLTTVCAFISNVVSPLPPVRTFGLVLALGVVSAFFSSTLIVGALHVVVERRNGGAKSKPRERTLDQYAEHLTAFQRHNTIPVLVVVILMTVGSIMVAAVKLETEFSLSDFLSDDMEVMEVRDDLYASYESAAWKPVSILFEPESGSQIISDDEQFLTGLWLLDKQIGSTNGVVIPTSILATARPSYDGVYPILRDAVERDAQFGQTYNLRIVDGQLATSDAYQTSGISAALANLSQNQTMGDKLSGASWSERVSEIVVVVNEVDGVNGIVKMRVTIDVEARTSRESAAIVDRMEDLVANLEADGLIDAQFYLTGDIVKLDDVITGLSYSQIKSTAVSLGISFLVLLAITRRFGASILVITPVAMAATWVAGAMAVLGMNWNVLTVMVTALTIGLGLDYTIHMWRRFESLSQAGVTGWEAMQNTFLTTGSALFISAGTTICGFLVLVLSPLPVIRDFGIVTAITVLFSLLLALLVLPGLLVLEADGHREKTSEED